MCVAVVGAQAAEPVGQVTLFRSGLDPGSNAIGLTPSPDGTLWFSDWFNNKLGRITTDGRITEQAGPAGSFAVGYDGNMWFPYGNRGVARLTTDGRFTLFPAAGITVTAVAAGADGNIWFTDTQNNAIGRLTPAGRITEFTFGLLAGSRPSAITAGPNATIWFTDTACSQRGQCAIGVISTITGHITEFPSSGTRQFGYPQAIAAGGDGNMWFSDVGSRLAIGRITPGGQVSEFSGGVGRLAAGGLAAGPDGNVWFTNYGDNTIGRITPQGLITEFSADLPLNQGPYPYGLALGPDGNLWFTVDNLRSASAGSTAIGRIGTGGPSPSTAPPRLLGVGRAGSVETCENAQWSTWAGRAPSLSLLASDGYEWLRDGVQLPMSGPTYVPTSADVGHRLSCVVTATYPVPFMVTVSAFSANVTVQASAPTPAVSHLRVTPQRFVVTGRRVGGRCVAATRANRLRRSCTRRVSLTVSYTLTGAGRVTFMLKHQTVGRLVGTSCVPATATGNATRCPLVVSLPKTIVRDGHRGVNNLVLQGWSGGTLAPGIYWLSATPTADGQAGVTRTKRVQIVR
jgi:virginiamycin B lyase